MAGESSPSIIYRRSTDFAICKTDVTKRYLDWAIKQGFAVIDVNIPKHVTDVNVCFFDSCGHISRSKLTSEVGCEDV